VDAASRTKVDDTRELLDNVQYAPARGAYKVYLIDEVHMLSAHSFNALLKTLEEAAAARQVPARDDRPAEAAGDGAVALPAVHLRRLPLSQIQERLAAIATAEQVEFEPAALRAIARSAEGSMRDALSLLDQVLAFGGGRALESEVRALLGTLDRRHVEAILEALAARDGGALMDCVGRLDERAPDYDQALGELAAALQRMALLQALPDLRGEDEEHDAMLAALAAKFRAGGPAVALPDRDHGPAGPRFRARRARRLRNGAAQDAGVPAAGTCGRVRRCGGRRCVGHARADRRAVHSRHPRRRGGNHHGGAGPRGGCGAAGDDWKAIVASLGLQGLAAQLAAHCVLVGRREGIVQLRLDEAGGHFLRPQLEQKLAEALSCHFGRETRLAIVRSSARSRRRPASRHARRMRASAPPSRPSSPTRTCGRCARSSGRSCSPDRSSP